MTLHSVHFSLFLCPWGRLTAELTSTIIVLIIEATPFVVAHAVASPSRSHIFSTLSRDSNIGVVYIQSSSHLFLPTIPVPHLYPLSGFLTRTHTWWRKLTNAVGCCGGRWEWGAMGLSPDVTEHKTSLKKSIWECQLSSGLLTSCSLWPERDAGSGFSMEQVLWPCCIRYPPMEMSSGFSSYPSCWLFFLSP